MTRLPTLEEFAKLGSTVSSDPAKKEALRQKIYALNGGNTHVDVGKLAVRIHLQAKSQGIAKATPIPVIKKFLSDILDDE
jgi:hypothetical protein